MMSDNPFPLSKAKLLEAYRIMRTIREFEERLHVDFARGDIPGFVHLYAGEEASAAGIMMHLNDNDRIASTHRGHGHCIAKGVDVKEMMAEIYGKATGSCRGKGGSMHIADLSKGMMGANGILGAGAPLACGAALAAQKLGDRRRGDLLRRRRRLEPGHVPGKPQSRGGLESAGDLRRREQRLCRIDLGRMGRGVDSYVDRATGFGLPGVTVDGTDFFAVYEAAGEIIKRAREGGGPSLLECKMVRFYGHFEGDAADLSRQGRARGHSRQQVTASSCFQARVGEAGVIAAAELEKIDGQVARLIDEAVVEAKAAALPQPGPSDRRLCRLLTTTILEGGQAMARKISMQACNQRGDRPGDARATRPSS